MKKLLSITCVMLLAAGIAVAQDTPPSGEQPAQPAPQEQTPQSDQAADQSSTTIRGCLSGSDNNFTISDQSGQSYKLSGDTSMLSQHVGHEVELTGKLGDMAAGEQPSGEQAGAATTGDQKLFEVSNVTMISEKCAAGTGEQPTPESGAAMSQPQSETAAPATSTTPDTSAQSTTPSTTTPDTSAQTTPPATTAPDASAQQTPPATTEPDAAQPAAPAQEEAAQQPETPEQPEQPATEAAPAQDQTQDQAAADEQLPQTATPLPLLALLGLGSLAAGLWSRRK
jgi:hypothetical protein